MSLREDLHELWVFAKGLADQYEENSKDSDYHFGKYMSYSNMASRIADILRGTDND